MMVITVVWIPVLVASLFVPRHGSVSSALTVIDYMVWALFVLEYLTKLYLYPNRWRFVRTHVLDLIIVVLPFLRPARLGRITQVTRVGAVAKRAIDHAKSIVTHQGLHFVLPAIALIIFASAGVVTIAERRVHGSSIHNLGDGLWWAFVTVATVGYGDASPVTPVGRGIAVFLMLAGIGLIGIPTATVASYFVGQNTEKTRAEREEMRQELAEASAERDQLTAKLDQLSEQMDQILLSVTSDGGPGQGAGKDP
jgi:voltage-gated potassium channel